MNRLQTLLLFALFSCVSLAEAQVYHEPYIVKQFEFLKTLQNVGEYEIEHTKSWIGDSTIRIHFFNYVNFYDTQFDSTAYFKYAEFDSRVDFDYVKFNSIAEFFRTQFNSKVDFSGVHRALKGRT